MIVARCNVHTQKESSFQINSPTSSRVIGRHLSDTLNSVSLVIVHLPPRTRDGRPIQQRILCSFELLALKSSWSSSSLQWTPYFSNPSIFRFSRYNSQKKSFSFPQWNTVMRTHKLYPWIHNFSSHWIYQFNFCILWRFEKSVYFCSFELFSSLLTGEKILNSLLPFQPFQTYFCSFLVGDRQEHFARGSKVREALPKSREVCSF